MKTFTIFLVTLSMFVIAAVSDDVKSAEKEVAAAGSQKTTVRGGYYPSYDKPYKPHYSPPKPKYCYKKICKDDYKCKYEECHCKKIEYVCDCLKYAEYYFKETKGGYKKSYGHEPYYKFVLKKVCVDYKLCDYSKCEKCKKCYKDTKCYKHKYVCGYYH